MSLYVPGNSIIHRLEPITKLIYVMVAGVLPFILPANPTAVLCLAVTLAMLTISKTLTKVIPLTGFTLLVLLSILFIQGLFHEHNQTFLFRFGPFVFFKEGLSYAARISLRVINLLLGISLLSLTTKPSDLIDSLVRRGLSPKIGYVLSSVLQIIPQMAASVNAITDAQRARGLETEGPLIVRAKAFLPLIGPVIMSSLIQARERAMALEVRGFNANRRKTFLRAANQSSRQTTIRILLILILFAAIVWRIFA